LADALVCRSELDQAETALLESIHIYSRANARRDRFEVALTQFRLGQLYGTMERENESTRVLLDVRDTFEDLARNSPDEPACVSKLVMLLTLSPDETSRDADRAVELAERLPGTSGHFWRLRALAHYRAGLYHEAIERAERAMSQLEGGDSNDRFILAIAHWKAGYRDQARRWYREAIARMADGFPHLYHDLGPLAVRQLKSEAEVLLTDSASQSRVSTNRGGDAK
jgi:tetratricopeptide (TPR) repeat protein